AQPAGERPPLSPVPPRIPAPPRGAAVDPAALPGSGARVVARSTADAEQTRSTGTAGNAEREDHTGER
ncbi:two-component sensor histidine kinase, partial [Streptomyces hydrogenans]